MAFPITLSYFNCHYLFLLVVGSDCNLCRSFLLSLYDSLRIYGGYFRFIGLKSTFSCRSIWKFHSQLNSLAFP